MRWKESGREGDRETEQERRRIQGREDRVARKGVHIEARGSRPTQGGTGDAVDLFLPLVLDSTKNDLELRLNIVVHPELSD